MRKKVLFFAISKKEMSGGQTMIYNALKTIDKSKYDVELIIQSECPLSQLVQNEGIPVHFLPFPKILIDKPLQSNKIYLLIKKIMLVLTLLIFSYRTYIFVRKHKYDVVWCENIKVLLAVALLKFSRVKLVFNMWSMVNSHIGLRLITLISDHIIVEGFFQKELFSQMKAPLISVIYTQIDERIFKNIRKDTTRKETNNTVIGFLGGCRYGKGFDIIVETAYELVVKQNLTNLFFCVAGASEDDDLLSNKELSLKINEIGDNIQIKEWIEDKTLFYGQIDIFISTSRSEGLPGAVREAMGFGLPVIATDVGGTQEALSNTGIVISEKEKGDIILQCGEHIKDLVYDKSKSNTLGSAARNRANALFIGNGWVKELEEVFYNL